MDKTNATEYPIRGRIPRLLLGFFLPPFLGALFMYFYFGYTESGIFKDPKILLFMIFSAFVHAGIPAFIYSLLMEYLFVPQAKIGALAAIGALLGGISGATPILIIDGLFFIKNNFEFFSLTIMLGAGIGVITSFILKRNYKQHYGHDATKYQMRGRIPRLFLGFFLPLLLGALFMSFYFGPIDVDPKGSFTFPFIIIFALVYAAGIPAFIYSLLMEYLVVPKAKTGALIAIGALLGGISGATPLFLLGGFSFIKNEFEFFSLVIMLGVSIGVITSLILKRNYKQHYG